MFCFYGPNCLNVLASSKMKVFFFLLCFVCMQHETRMSWFNLTAQEIQPLYYHMDLQDQGWVRSSGCTENPWTGGCSLLLEGLIPATLKTPVCAKCVCVFCSDFILLEGRVVHRENGTHSFVSLLKIHPWEGNRKAHFQFQSIQLNSGLFI